MLASTLNNEVIRASTTDETHLHGLNALNALNALGVAVAFAAVGPLAQVPQGSSGSENFGESVLEAGVAGSTMPHFVGLGLAVATL